MKVHLGFFELESNSVPLPQQVFSPPLFIACQAVKLAPSSVVSFELQMTLLPRQVAGIHIVPERL